MTVNNGPFITKCSAQTRYQADVWKKKVFFSVTLVSKVAQGDRDHSCIFQIFGVMSWCFASTFKDSLRWLGNTHCIIGYSDGFDRVPPHLSPRKNRFFEPLKTK